MMCELCKDRGVLLPSKQKPNGPVWEPCHCPAGMPWREVAVAESDPPACINCGAVAEVMMLSIRPRCKACERKDNDLRRARMEVWS